jgi:hypothetical protein
MALWLGILIASYVVFSRWLGRTRTTPTARVGWTRPGAARWMTRAIDWGDRSPTVLQLWAVDGEGRPGVLEPVGEDQHGGDVVQQRDDQHEHHIALESLLQAVAPHHQRERVRVPDALERLQQERNRARER